MILRRLDREVTFHATTWSVGRIFVERLPGGAVCIHHVGVFEATFSSIESVSFIDPASGLSPGSNGLLHVNGVRLLPPSYPNDLTEIRASHLSCLAVGLRWLMQPNGWALIYNNHYKIGVDIHDHTETLID